MMRPARHGELPHRYLERAPVPPSRVCRDGRAYARNGQIAVPNAGVLRPRRELEAGKKRTGGARFAGAREGVAEDRRRRGLDRETTDKPRCVVERILTARS